MKGSLQNNVIGIIIAAIVLAILIPAGNKLYTQISQKTPQQALADEISSLINDLQPGTIAYTFKGFEKLYDLYFTDLSPEDLENPEVWHVRAWSKQDLSKPETSECLTTSCLCVCKDDCTENKFCRSIHSDSIEIEGHYISAHPAQALPFPRPAYSEEITSDKIILKNLLLEVKIEKTQNRVKMTYLSDEYARYKNE